MVVFDTCIASGEATGGKCGHGMVDTVEDIHAEEIECAGTYYGENEENGPDALCRTAQTWMQFGLDRTGGFGGKHFHRTAYHGRKDGYGEEYDTQTANPL